MARNANRVLELIVGRVLPIGFLTGQEDVESDSAR